MRGEAPAPGARGRHKCGSAAWARPAPTGRHAGVTPTTTPRSALLRPVGDAPSVASMAPGGATVAPRPSCCGRVEQVHLALPTCALPTCTDLRPPPEVRRVRLPRPVLIATVIITATGSLLLAPHSATADREPPVREGAGRAGADQPQGAAKGPANAARNALT